MGAIYGAENSLWKENILQTRLAEEHSLTLFVYDF